MTDLPPYPVSRGRTAANQLRKMLRQIDTAIASQEAVMADLQRSYGIAFQTQDEQNALRARIRQTAYPNRSTR